jgi:hypothetical membrane protein
MNGEFLLLGFAMAVGAVLIYYEFSEANAGQRLAAQVGFSCLAIAGVGAVVVGLFPENTVHVVHIAGATLAIGIGTLGILVLGIALPLPRLLHWGMVVVPPVALTALVLVAVHVYLGLGIGTVERVAAYPETLWLILFGVYTGRTRGGLRVRAARYTSSRT